MLFFLKAGTVLEELSKCKVVKTVAYDAFV